MVEYDVFIIHADPDKASALRLREALARLGVRAFVDRPDAPPGPWDEAIPKVLRGALLWAALVGSDDRHYQQEELVVAIREMRALGTADRIVPVMLAPRTDLPYGLNRQQALIWEGADTVAAALSTRVTALRGGRPDGAQRRVKVAVVGLKDELADELEMLRRRIAQRTAILDGEVHLVDVARDPIPEVDLRVVLLGGRHGGKLELLRDVVTAARGDRPSAATPAPRTTKPASVVHSDAISTIAAKLKIDPDAIEEPFLDELTDMTRLRRGVELEGNRATVIDALDERIATWYAARFPSQPGMSIARAPWEERYLEDKAPLWRKGDPSALRSLGGARVDRDRWHVHLVADEPWDEVEGELQYSPRGWTVGLEHEALEPGVPAALQLPAMRETAESVSVRPPLLDRVLSHALLPRTVIVGPAGTGKTVLLQHLAWVLASDEPPGPDPEAAHHVDRAGVRGEGLVPPIPILHTATTLATHLRGDRPIREALVSILRSSDTFGEDADAATVRAGIDAGRYIFLIDSLDEVPRRQDREALVAAFGTLAGATPRVVLTTRPGAHTDVELPHGFARVDIAPLDEDAQERLARAWAACWAPAEDLDQILRAVASVRESYPTDPYGRSPVANPLLLSCILHVYATYHRLPDDTAKLYADMVRVLCEAKVRAADDRECDTIVERYRVALRGLFFACQERGGTRLDLAEARELLVASHFASRDRVDGALQALANHTGLLRFESIGHHTALRPWHRSYQEYLAAEAIAVDYANRAAECVTWLRSPRADRGSRLDDPSWRGTLRFLIGAATHFNPQWGARLVEELAAAADETRRDHVRLLVLAGEGCADYATSLFANEPIRRTLPHTIATAFHATGATWPVVDRIDALEALGRLDDPRLADPRTTTHDPGWVHVPTGTHVIGGAPRKVRKNPLTRSRRPVKRASDPADTQEVHTSPGFWIRRWPITVGELLPFVDEVLAGAWTMSSRTSRRREILRADQAAQIALEPGGQRDLILARPLAVDEFASGLSRLLGSLPSQRRHLTRPAVDVHWDVAREFCRWAQTRWRLPMDAQVDLPTSAEWEIAAHRGTDRIYAWGDEPPGAGDDAMAAHAWKGAPPLRWGPTPVGAFPLGHTPDRLWDITGNVAEWCATDMEEGDLPIDEDGDTGAALNPCYRGGSWRHDGDSLSLARVGHHSAENDWIGFRVVLRPKTG